MRASGGKKKTDKIIFHIPHDGRNFDKELLDSVCVSREDFMRYDDMMRDKHVSVLVPDVGAEVMRFPLSRLLCDVERFADGSESMEKYGMGFCCEKAFDNTVIKNVTKTVRARTKAFYDGWHGKLDAAISGCTDVLFIDLHSYNPEATVSELLHGGELPDVCIGTDERFTPPELLSAALSEFEKIGLTAAVNYPYQGVLVPDAAYYAGTPCRVYAIMTEFHRRAYLTESGGVDVEKCKAIRAALEKICRF